MLCSCRDPACGAVGKHPRTPHGLNDATGDPAQLGRWWRHWPQANIGLVTGEVADVLDIDGPAGRAALCRFTADHDLRLDGPLVRTGSGWHLYLAPTGSGIEPVCWSRWTGMAAAAMSLPHLLDMPAAALTSGCGHSPPGFPQRRRHCMASSTPPEPTQLSRFPRHRSAQPLPIIHMAAPRSSRNWPPSPTPPTAAATTPCIKPESASTAWSPVASSPATRSRPAYSPPRKRPGSWSRSQPRPAAPSPPPNAPGEPTLAASQPPGSQTTRHRFEGRAGGHEAMRTGSGMADSADPVHPPPSSPADRTRRQQSGGHVDS